VAERQLPKLNVAGSIPVSRSTILNVKTALPLLRAPFFGCADVKISTQAAGNY
jgi:hypothetical protein